MASWQLKTLKHHRDQPPLRLSAVGKARISCQYCAIRAACIPGHALPHLRADCAAVCSASKRRAYSQAASTPDSAHNANLRGSQT
eukprot:364818-Chlamydomonas_euryale.AAC.34